MKKAVRELLKWTPASVNLKEYSEYADDDDCKAPFFSEAYLYNLIGKDDARSLLSLMEKALKSLGEKVEL